MNYKDLMDSFIIRMNKDMENKDKRENITAHASIFSNNIRKNFKNSQDNIEYLKGEILQSPLNNIMDINEVIDGEKISSSQIKNNLKNKK